MSDNSKKSELFSLKIKAALHDPPQKPLVLGLGGKGHEIDAGEYIKILLPEDPSFDKDKWKFADHVASAADRTSFPLDRDQNQFKADFRKNPVITHPTSGALFELGQFNQIEADKIHGNVVAAMKAIREESGGDPEKIYLNYWRSFPAFMKKVEQGNHQIGHLWNFLPADTRIPDHSVLDHQRVVSAFAAAGITKDEVSASFVLFNIGPVQEFIAAAKKTQDLWAGSYLLSWLNWQAMKVFAEAYGPDCILFPDLHGQPLVDYWLKHDKGISLSDRDFDPRDLSAPTLPNRFFAVVPKAVAETLCKEAENAVVQGLLNAGDYAWQQLAEHFPDIKDASKPEKEMWDAQLKNFTECYWGVLDLPDWTEGMADIKAEFHSMYGKLFEKKSEEGDKKEDDEKFKKQNERDLILHAYTEGGFKPNLGTLYGRFYEILEKAVGARKGLRNFSQNVESGYRCSLIPGLAALVPANADTYKYGEFWRQFTLGLNKAGRIKTIIGKSERLSPVALTKRLFPDFLEKSALAKEQDWDKLFVSTHSIAVADFRLALIEWLKEATVEQKEILDDFLRDAADFQKLTNLRPEFGLSKIRNTAKNDELENLPHCNNIACLPGEFFQLDYLEGNYINDLKAAFLDDEEGKTDSQVARQIATRLSQSLKKLISISKLTAPTKYYAILYLDGDNMGKWLSGDEAPDFHTVLHQEAVKRLVDGIEGSTSNEKVYEGWAKILEVKDGQVQSSKKRPQAPTQHMAISRALNHFSLKLVRTIVEERFLGKLIYAGGDDVVAMVSLNDALPCAEMLRAAFSGHLKQNGESKALVNLESSLRTNESKGYVGFKKSGENDIAMTLGKSATASVGIAVAHYQYPLRQATADARKAEKYAKNTLNRDAFAVNIVKRSGQTFTTGAAWRLGKDSSVKLVNEDILKPFAEAIQKNHLSPKFIVEVNEALPILEALPQNAILAEVKRLFMQHAEGFRKSDINANEWFDKHIIPLIEHCDHLINPVDKTKPDHKLKQKPMLNGSPGEWPALRNAVQLMDMAHYIGKGGGR